MNIALIIAGGKGVRVGVGIPKQFVKVMNKPIIQYTMQTFNNCSAIDKICVVCIEGWANEVYKIAKENGFNKLDTVINGGETRHESITNAISSLKLSDDDVLIIVDANRPLIPENVIINGIETAKLRNGVSLTCEPCYDSMYLTEDGNTISGAVDRRKIIKGQGPEFATFKEIKNLYALAKKNDIIDKTTSELALYFGVPVNIVEGSFKCFKITVKEDFELFETLLKLGLN